MATDMQAVIWHIKKKPSRFWGHIKKSDDCWLWQGYKSRKGYGMMRYPKGRATTHRISWFLYYGAITPKQFVCHHCDTPMCVRPEHLFLGSHQDNMDDMKEKNREPHVIGNYKINYEIAEQIRNEQKRGLSNSQLRLKYKLCKSTISYIVNKKIWNTDAILGKRRRCH